MPTTLPQPDAVPATDKQDAMGAYLMVLGALYFGLPLPLLGFIASWIYHGIHAKKAPFVTFHTYQALLLSIPASVISAAWLVWGTFLLIDFLQQRPVPGLTVFAVFSVFSVLVYLAYLVFCIVGAVRANKGRMIYFPLFGRAAFERYFGEPRPAREAPRNRPPKGL